MKITQQKIPIKLRRTAARHLESIRGTEMALNSEDLYLADTVVPIFRPDLKEPAYYEFQIIKETRVLDNRNDLTEKVGKINVYSTSGLKEVYGTQGFVSELKPAYAERFKTGVQGFIIVSASNHDYPITHWSMESEPPSELLQTMAAEKKSELNKVYKIDALSYVGEDKAGNEVANLGQKPAIINGLIEDLSSEAGKISSAEMTRKATRSKDDSVRTRQGRLTLRGPKPKKIEFVSSDWDMLKKNFEKSFKPLMKQLEISASKEWEKDSMMDELGEGILAGDQFYLPVLEKEFTVELSGEASEFTVLRVVKRPNGMSAIELTTKQLPDSGESDLFVQIRYRDSEELIRLFVVNPDSPTESINNLKNEE